MFPKAGSGTSEFRRLCITLFLIAAFVVSGALPSVAANTWIVDTISDDANAGSGTSGSLRWALNQASDGDTIQFADSLAGQTVTSSALATGVIRFLN